MPSLAHSLLIICWSATNVLAQVNSTTDSEEPPIGGFVPKNSLSYIGLIAYGVSAIIHWTQYFAITPRRPFMATLPIGMTAMALGFVLRLIYANPPYTIMKYIPMTLFILLSVPLLVFGNRLHVARTSRSDVRRSGVRSLPTDTVIPIVRLFVWSDVTTFLLQSTGGGLSATKNADTANLGTNISLVGLFIQAISFLLFTTVLVVFAWRVRTEFPALWRPKHARPFKLISAEPIDDWRTLFYVMCLTCIGILIRSIFRIAEFAGGYSGTIATHEAYFYLFDALPLWISMTLFCVVWPVRVLNAGPAAAGMELLPPAKQSVQKLMQRYDEA
ncbi:RTA1 like protein-domain-containing protein [Mycena crocata]|nr:RTA1 like protein-domain-containing protein [Mycena crocata]